MISLSIWEQESFYSPKDIIIVGAGLMGLWTAWELLQQNPSLRIVIIERNSTPLGASTRNAGFACFGSPTELMSNMEVLGIHDMLQVVEMRYRGIEKIKNHFPDELIGFEHCGGYECINKDSRFWPALDDRISQLNKLLKDITGHRSIFKYAGNKLPDLGLQHFDTLIENSTEAALHSGKLVQALTQELLIKGVTILPGFSVKEWQKNSNGFEVISANHQFIKGTKLIFCTNGFSNTLLDTKNIQPGRGQIILTSPIPNLPMKGTFHFDEGYYYWRHLGNRILLGGGRNADFEGENTTELNGSDIIRNTLISFLQKHLSPSLQYSIEHSWSGIMGFTDDKQPFTGYVKDGAYLAVACNGMGVALTPIIAETIASDILA
ncbi:MAG: NAD(P)/FAD-dependent oxidoreductase [Bacteroidota bacterium]